MGFDKTKSVLFTSGGDKWVLTSQYQLVSSSQETTVLFSKIPHHLHGNPHAQVAKPTHIVCCLLLYCPLNILLRQCSAMPSWPNLEILYVAQWEISPLGVFLRLCFAKFGAHNFHVTGRCIPPKFALCKKYSLQQILISIDENKKRRHFISRMQRPKYPPF